MTELSFLYSSLSIFFRSRSSFDLSDVWAEVVACLPASVAVRIIPQMLHLSFSASGMQLMRFSWL